MARIIAGVGTSHTPAIGAAVDNGKVAEPYWAPLFKGYEPAKQWMAKTKPDVAIVVYNDHVNAFDFKIIPTFALGCGAEFPIADEGWGAQPIEYLRDAGAEAIELVMWLIMRGALGKQVREVYRFYHVPASSTGVGNIILEAA